MFSLRDLSEALKSLAEGLVWFVAFCFVAVMPVPAQWKLLLIAGWFLAAFIQLYREVKK